MPLRNRVHSVWVHLVKAIQQPRMGRCLRKTRKRKRASTWRDGVTKSIVLRIYNKGPVEVQAHWVKYDGELQQYGTIKPGGMLPLSSFSTHGWCLRVAGGGDLYYLGDSAILSVQPNGTLHVKPLGNDTSGDDDDDTSWMKPEWGKYRQRGVVQDIPIMAFDCVSQAAVSECSSCISHMLATCNPHVLRRVQQAGCKLAIIGCDQVTSDIPDHHFMKQQAEAGGRDIDTTARGLGATPAVPTASCGEENILMLNDTRYNQESILVHEFAHAVMNLGFDNQQKIQIEKLFKHAQDKKLYASDCYMMSNPEEYWAEGSQVWFGATVRTDVTSGINTRQLLQQHDPGLARMMLSVYGPNSWQYINTCSGSFATLVQDGFQQSEPAEQSAAKPVGRYMLRPRKSPLKSASPASR